MQILTTHQCEIISGATRTSWDILEESFLLGVTVGGSCALAGTCLGLMLDTEEFFACMIGLLTVPGGISFGANLLHGLYTEDFLS